MDTEKNGHTIEYIFRNNVLLPSAVIRKGPVTYALGAVISLFLCFRRCSYPKACSGISEVLAEISDVSS